jgi:hypothetical protein
MEEMKPIVDPKVVPLGVFAEQTSIDTKFT